MTSASTTTTQTRAGRPDYGLMELIHPVDAETFDRDYREKMPLVVKRADPAYYAHLLTLDDMDRILSTMSVPESTIRLVSQGNGIPLPSLAASGAGRAAEELYGQYRAGATITVLYLHERWPPLARLCAAVAAELSATVQTNVYLTPRHAQGLKPHHDTHDVFVAQIHGTKHWRLYESPVRLPLTEHRQADQGREPGGPVREFDLEPGDLLYLPRGTVHDATSGDDASLHLTIGASPLTWGAIIQIAVNEALHRDAGLREALPQAVTGDGWQQAAQNRLTALLGNVRDQLDAGTLITEARRALLDNSQPQLGGHLLDLEALHSLDLDTPVRPREAMSCTVTADNGAVYLRFHGKSIRMPGRIAPEVRFVADSAELTGREIPGQLDDRGRLVLLRILLREGFLTRAPAASPPRG